MPRIKIFAPSDVSNKLINFAVDVNVCRIVREITKKCIGLNTKKSAKHSKTAKTTLNSKSQAFSKPLNKMMIYKHKSKVNNMTLKHCRQLNPNKEKFGQILWRSIIKLFHHLKKNQMMGSINKLSKKNKSLRQLMTIKNLHLINNSLIKWN